MRLLSIMDLILGDMVVADRGDVSLPADQGMALVSRSVDLGKVSAIGLSVDEDRQHARFAFKTEGGSFAVSLPPALVTLLAANVQDIVTKTGD